MKRIFLALFLLTEAGLAEAITGSIYIPAAYPLDSSKVQGAGQGVSANASASTTTNIDLDLTDDEIITGIEEITSGTTMGDFIDLKVVLTSNKSIVIATPITNWYVSNNVDNDFRLEIPMKLQSGWTLRIVYHATGLLATPFVAINYKLWKVLI